MRTLTMDEVGFVSGGLTLLDVRGSTPGEVARNTGRMEDYGWASVESDGDNSLVITAMRVGDKYVDSDGNLNTLYDVKAHQQDLALLATGAAFIPKVGPFIVLGIGVYGWAVGRSNPDDVGKHTVVAPPFTEPGLQQK